VFFPQYVLVEGVCTCGDLDLMLSNSRVGHDIGFRELGGDGAGSAAGAARAAPNDGADRVHVAIEEGI
jgi:hypothetical protein